MGNKKWDNLSNEDFLQILKDLYLINPKNLNYEIYKNNRKNLNVPSIKSFTNRFNLTWIEILKLANISKESIKKSKPSNINPKSGVYKITNIINNKIYIGSSRNIKNRFCRHIDEFNKGIHKNPHFQSSWKKYGQENFKFEVIEYVDDIEKLVEREQYWLDYYQSYNNKIGYNICSVAYSCLGIKRSEESKQKMRKPRTKTLLKLKYQKETNSSNTIKKNKTPKIHKEKIKKSKEEIFKTRSEATSGEKNGNHKLTTEDVKEIKKLLLLGYYSNNELAIKFNINPRVISSIKNNKSWKSVTI